MKHYVGPARYSTQNIPISASTKPIDIGFLSDTLSTAVSINKRSQERTQTSVDTPEQKPVQNLAIDNTQYPDVYDEQEEETKHRRTYGTAVDNSQYSTPPVGDYGMVSPQRNPQGVYGPNMYNASASNTEWGRRQF